MSCWDEMPFTKSMKTAAPACAGTLPNLLVRLLLLACCLAPVGAATITWTGASGTSNDWSDGANWAGGVPAGSADVALFDNAAPPRQPNVDGATSVGGLSFAATAAAVTIGGASTLTIGTSGIDASLATADHVLAAPINASATQTWTIASGRTVTCTGAVTRTAITGSLTITTGTAHFLGLVTMTAGSSNVAMTGSGTIRFSGGVNCAGSSPSINIFNSGGGGLVEFATSQTLTLTDSSLQIYPQNSDDIAFAPGITLTVDGGSFSMRTPNTAARTITTSGWSNVTLAGVSGASFTLVIRGGTTQPLPLNAEMTFGLPVVVFPGNSTATVQIPDGRTLGSDLTIASNASSCSMHFLGDATIAGDLVMDHNSGAGSATMTLSFTADGIIDVGGSVRYANNNGTGTCVVNAARAAFTLDVAGALDLADADGVLQVYLGAGTWSAAAGADLRGVDLLDCTFGTTSGRLDVTGALVLGGGLSVHQGAGFAAGTYRVADCTGGVTGTFSALMAVPGTMSGSVSTATPNQVDLILSADTWAEWDGGGADDNWSNGLNWVGDSAPASGSDVRFPSGTNWTVIIDTPQTVDRLDLAGGTTNTCAFTVNAALTVDGLLTNGVSGSLVNTFTGASTVTLRGGVDSGGDITFACPVDFDGAQTLRGVAQKQFTCSHANGWTLSGHTITIDGLIFKTVSANPAVLTVLAGGTLQAINDGRVTFNYAVSGAVPPDADLIIDAPLWLDNGDRIFTLRTGSTTFLGDVVTDSVGSAVRALMQGTTTVAGSVRLRPRGAGGNRLRFAAGAVATLGGLVYEPIVGQSSAASINNDTPVACTINVDGPLTLADTTTGTGSLTLNLSGSTLRARGAAIDLSGVDTLTCTTTGTLVVGGGAGSPTWTYSDTATPMTTQASFNSLDVTIGANGTVSGTSGTTGVRCGTLTVQSGGTLSPGGISAMTMMEVGGLTLEAGSTFRVQLGAPGTSDRITGPAAGTPALAGTLVVSDGGGIASGTYTIIDGFSNTATGSFTTVTMPIGYAAVVDTATPGEVKLVVTATPYRWTGASGSSSAWSDTANWSTGVVPGASEVAIFDLGSYPRQPSLGAGAAVAGLRIDATSAAVTIGGASTLTIGASGIDASAAVADLTVSAPLASGAAQTWAVAAGRTVTVSGGLDLQATIVTTSGTGAVVVTGVSVAAGTVTGRIAANADLTLGGQLTVTAGAGFGGGTFTIATHGGTLSGAFASMTLPNGYSGEVVSGSGSVRLCVDYPMTWTGAVSTDWSAGGNWAGGVAPTASDTVYFTRSAPARQPTLTGDAQITAVVVGAFAPAMTIGGVGRTLTVANTVAWTGLEMTSATADLTVTPMVSVATGGTGTNADCTWNIAAGRTVTLAGGLTKSGDSRINVTLTGTVAVTGGLVIEANTGDDSVITSGTALLRLAGGVTINSLHPSGKIDIRIPTAFSASQTITVPVGGYLVVTRGTVHIDAAVVLTVNGGRLSFENRGGGTVGGTWAGGRIIGTGSFAIAPNNATQTFPTAAQIEIDVPMALMMRGASAVAFTMPSGLDLGAGLDVSTYQNTTVTFSGDATIGGDLTTSWFLNNRTKTIVLPSGNTVTLTGAFVPVVSTDTTVLDASGATLRCQGGATSLAGLDTLTLASAGTLVIGGGAGAATFTYSDASTPVTTAASWSSLNLTVAANGTIAGDSGATGLACGTVTVQNGGTLSPGGAAVAQMKVGALTLQAGGSFAVQLGAPGTCDLVTGAGAGAPALGGTLTVTDAGGLAAGTYTIVDGFASAATGSFTTVSMPLGWTGTIDTATAGTVKLVVSLTPYRWTGASGTGDEWADTANWSTGAVPGAADTAIFDLADYPRHPTLAAPASVGGLRLAATSEAVVIAGAALTVGTGGIDLSAATADLDISAPATFALAQPWALPTGRTLRFGGTFDKSGNTSITITGAGTVRFDGAVAIDLAVNDPIKLSTATLPSADLQFAAGIVFDATGTTSTNIQGQATFIGSQTVTIPASCYVAFYTGIVNFPAPAVVTVSTGELRIENPTGTIGGGVVSGTWNGGEFATTNGGLVKFSAVCGKTQVLPTNAEITFSGRFSTSFRSSGTITHQVPDGVAFGSDVVPANSSQSQVLEFLGDATIGGSLLHMHAPSSGGKLQNIAFTPGGTVTVSGGLGWYTASPTASSSVTINPGGVAHTLIVDGSLAYGTTTGTTAIDLSGSTWKARGTITLDGVDTLTLATPGTLEIGGGAGATTFTYSDTGTAITTAASWSSLDLTVAANGTIAGTSGTTGLACGTVTVQSSGTLSPGGTGSMAQMKVGALTLQAGGAYVVQLGAASACDRVTGSGAGAPALGGTLTVTDGGGMAAGTYTIIDGFAGTATGSFATVSMPTGWVATVDTATAGQVKLVVSAVTLVTARTTRDLDNDGRIDAIDITCDSTLDDDFSAITVDVTGRSGEVVTTGATAGDAVFRVTFTEGGAADTDAVPQVRIVSNGSLADSATGTELVAIEGAASTPDDGAAPVLVAAAWTDVDGNGVDAGDTVLLTFSEALVDVGGGLVTGDLTLPVTGDGWGTSSIAGSGTTRTVTLGGTPALTPGGTFSALATTDGKPSGVALGSGAHGGDAAGNGGNTAAAAIDLAGSNLISIAWSSGSDPKTWAVGSLGTGLSANTVGGPDLLMRNTGDTTLRLRIRGSTAAPAGWTAAAGAQGINEYRLLAAADTTAAQSAPTATGSYPLQVTGVDQNLVTGFRSGGTQDLELHLTTPPAITAGAGVEQTITVTLTADAP